MTAFGPGWAGGRADLWLHPLGGPVLGLRRHDDGSATDIYLARQLPLHNGRALGLAGRIAICALGFVPLLLGRHRHRNLVAQARARVLSGQRATSPSITSLNP